MRASVYLLIGNTLERLDRWVEAVESFQHAIGLDPNYSEAYNNLGVALVETGRNREAIAAYAKTIEINPNHANAYFNLGKLSVKLSEYHAALQMFEKALAIQPLHAYAHHELGCLQEMNGQLAMAASSYQKSLELDPSRTVRQNLAAVLALMGEPRGIDQLRQLVHEQPLDPESHWNLGTGLLLHGNYEEGWREFEWRTQIPRFRDHHHRFPQPPWRGEPLEGKTILLYGEQGHGDTLQFLRYVPLVAERGGRIILEVPGLLRRLLQGFPGVADCVAFGDANPDFSTHASLMSLPYLLQATSIPPPIAPLRWTKVNHPQSHPLRVGLAWAGSPKNKRDRLRSIPLALLNPLTHLRGVAFTSLQMGPTPLPTGDSSFNFVDDCRDLPDFADLALVLSDLDLVITVDTAVAHLAGMMGKPVWILLSNAGDWRWGLQGPSTDWYSSAKLFRQNTPADWSGVVATVSQKLQKQTRRSRRTRIDVTHGRN
jgi:hypothetical protein